MVCCPGAGLVVGGGSVVGGSGHEVAVASNFPAADAVAQLDAWIKVHPKDAQGYQVLGRVHGLAWAYGKSIPLISLGGPDALPAFSESSTVLVTRSGPSEPTLPTMQTAEHKSVQ